MDEFCEISEKKYKRMRRAAIILTVVAVLLVAAFSIWTIKLSQWVCYIPDGGVWYCEELGMEADLRYGWDKMTTTSGEQLSIAKHPGCNQIVLNRTVDLKPIEEDGKLVYEPKYEVVCHYTAVALQEDQWTVCDKNGNEYVFVRK